MTEQQVERLAAIGGGAHYLDFREARQHALQDVQHQRGIVYQQDPDCRLLDWGLRSSHFLFSLAVLIDEIVMANFTNAPFNPSYQILLAEPLAL